MNAVQIGLLTAICLCVAPVAHAHEPLWGESPQTFAFGVIHPEIRFGFENDTLLLNGDRRIGNPDGLSRSRFETLLGLQYAPKTSLNLKLEIPIVQVLTSQRIAGMDRHSGATGLGDIMLSAKSRFYQKYGEDWKVHQSYTVGVQLPTGAHGGRTPNGLLFAPSDQPGSGKFGILLGYAFAYERLNDTVWASAVYMHDLGNRGSKGDMLDVDANYGYWIRRARRPQDLGVILAAGTHLEGMGHDRQGADADPDSGSTLAGLQSSLIVTRGQAQFRIGILVPLYQCVSGTQLRSEIQARAGIEILL